MLSADKVNPTDILAVTGASAALHISPMPWAGPIAGVRVAKVGDKLIANPTYAELAESRCDLVVVAMKDAIAMVEGQADEMTEEEMVEALAFAKDAVQGVLELQERIREAVGKEKFAVPEVKKDADIAARVEAVALEKIKEACNVREKHPRYAALKKGKKETVAALAGEFPDREGEIKAAYEELKYNTMRAQVVYDKRRVDGRDSKTVRPIAIEAGLLPRTHGSALFTRGETQSIVTATLGTRRDEQKIDGLIGRGTGRTSSSTTTSRPTASVRPSSCAAPAAARSATARSPSARSKGQIPDNESFPYTIRIVSEITESNGSSSMATVCGGSLAMMDAGVPIKAPVAGVAMGLIMEGDKDYAVLTDILGDEDHLGDMDFKVCGTEKGITAIQMDIKIEGLAQEIMSEAMKQARDGASAHPRQDERGARDRARATSASTLRASRRSRSSPTRSARSSARGAR